MKRLTSLLLVSAMGIGCLVINGCRLDSDDKKEKGQGVHIIPGPGEPGYDAALEERMERYFKAFKTFSTAPFGWALDSYVGNTTDRGVIERFVNENPRDLDFREFCLRDPECDDGYTVYRRVNGSTVMEEGIIKGFGEFGDLGMFGGVAAATDLFRYAVLKEQGYPEEMVHEARQRVIRLVEANHIMYTIAGTPGVVVRGIRLKDLGNYQSQVEPLFGDSGEPLPEPKHGVLREDYSGFYPEWLWNDDTSKDQVDGFMFAMGIMWDIVAEDPEIPQYLKDWMVEDARDFGDMLMTVAPETGTDMVMRDGDDRLPAWCDVNPNILNFSGCPGATSPEPTHSFNAVMGLGFVKVLYHVTGDEKLRAFYYDDLVGTRKWDEFTVTSPLPMVDMSYATNYSNVNMAFVAYYNALRYEADPVVRSKLQWSLEHVLWDNGGDRQPSEIHQSFFDIIFTGLRAGPNLPGVVAGAIQTANEFHGPPGFNDPMINCEPEEILQGWCLAVDNETIITLAPTEYRYGGHNSSLVAEHVIPRRLRENSNSEPQRRAARRLLDGPLPLRRERVRAQRLSHRPPARASGRARGPLRGRRLGNTDQPVVERPDQQGAGVRDRAADLSGRPVRKDRVNGHGHRVLPRHRSAARHHLRVSA
jgi:hypothetical protein